MGFSTWKSKQSLKTANRYRNLTLICHGQRSLAHLFMWQPEADTELKPSALPATALGQSTYINL